MTPKRMIAATGLLETYLTEHPLTAKSQAELLLMANCLAPQLTLDKQCAIAILMEIALTAHPYSDEIVDLLVGLK